MSNTENLTTGDVFTAPCGREFVAKTDARVGVTRANANRHAAACDACADVQVANDTAPVVDRTLTDGIDLRPAVAAAAERVNAGTKFEVTPTRNVARMVRVSLDVRITTDGRHLVARTGTGDATWSLYALDPLAGPVAGVRFLAHHRTVDEAFAPANLT